MYKWHTVMIVIILCLFPPKQKARKHLNVKQMLHIFISQPMKGQAVLCTTKATDKRQMIVINHESHGTLERLNGNKFVGVQCMSSWLDGPECAFLVSMCLQKKYCSAPPICISLNSERLGTCTVHFLATSTLSGAWKDVLTYFTFYLFQEGYWI